MQESQPLANTSSVPSYLDSLNDAQRQAVEATEGPVLVLAGAGTGKTRALTTRLAHVLYTGRAFSSQILAVTFTNKAAQEMKMRVAKLLGGESVEGWWLGTFHSIAARMLRSHASRVGLSGNFTILDADDSTRLVKQLMEGLNINVKKWPPKAVSAHIAGWKDKAFLPSDVVSDDSGDLADGKTKEIYALYQERLKSLNACDFGDLLLHIITILKDPKQSDILQEYHRRFRYIMVDEYQDTNTAQYLWLRLLAKGSNNICCVGDDDQSIYGWRGAEVENILRFEKDFSGAKVIRLEKNYRSTGHILASANKVISYNQQRLGKDLYTHSDDGEKVIVKGLWDASAEARWVSEEIESLHNKKWSLDQIAVLVRTGFQMREFEERFIQLNIPYRVIGGPRFYERMEIRDALAYLRVSSQKDDDLALERIINLPKRGIGNSTLNALYQHARSQGISLYQAIEELVQTDELRPKVRTTLQNLVQSFNRWRDLIQTMPHEQVADTILEESGYVAMWKSDKSPEAPGRIENLKEFVSAMGDFESLAAFLEHVALVLDNQDNKEGEHATLMTLHAAKGLEFDAVFLAGWEDGLFPSQRALDESGMRGLEEERRLAYVGITRARKRAYISYAASRRMYGQWINSTPSRFIDELPPEHISMQAEQGLYGHNRSSHWDSSGIKGVQPASLSRTQPSGKEKGQEIGEESQLQEFYRGARVSHNSFGLGTIIHIDGHKLDIHFDDSGKKRVMDSFVTLED